MAVYPDNYYLYATISGSLIDITPYTIKTDIKGEWGISGIEKTNVLADTGSMNFTLTNRSGLFTPGDVDCMGGWQKGIVIELVIIYNGSQFKRFRGTLATLKYNDDDFTVDCTVLDWLDYSAKYPIALLASVANKRADEGLTTLVDAVPIQPIARQFDISISTLGVLFDSTSANTKAYTEFSNLCNSEFSNLYLRKDKTNGELLVFENRHHRSGWSELDSVDESVDIDNSTGGKVTNSTGGKILSSLIDYTAIFDNNMNDINTVYGEGVINSMTVTANPKTVDSSSRIMYSLAQPFFIGSGETINFYGAYVDASGNKCNGTNMIAPVVNTDFTANTLANGTGTNISGSISGSAIFGSAQVKFTYTNSYGSGGWITKSNARGYGIYAYTTIEAKEENQESYETYGYQNAALNQPYQTDLLVGKDVIESIVELEKKPRTKVTDVSFLANTDDFLMLSFLYLDVGSLIHLKDDRYDIDGYFYIQKVKFTIKNGGIIMFTFVLRAFLCLALGLTPVTIQCSGSTTDAINFGVTPAVTNLPLMSLSVDVYPTRYRGTIFMNYQSSGIGSGGFQLASNSTGTLNFTVAFDSPGNVWYSTETIPLNDWTTIVATIDASTRTPHMFLDGVEATLTLVLGGDTGGLKDATGANFVVGNFYTTAYPYQYPFIGKFKNPAVYNVILSQADSVTLTNGGSVTNGLVWQGNCIRTSDIDIYNNAELDSTMKILDNIYGDIGTPVGSPLCLIP